MNQLRYNQYSIVAEINQQNVLVKNLILKILNSRRLLIDHTEVVEEAIEHLNTFDGPKSEYLTLLRTSAVISCINVIGLHCNRSVKTICALTSGFASIPYILKIISTHRKSKYETKLKRFINTLDNFESAVKKNRIFLQETLFSKTSSITLKKYDKENKIVSNLVKGIKNVIDGIYKFLKFMEMFKIPEQIEVLYEPIEELKDCELMTRSLEENVDLKTIKDFFNIFAYVQSQTLLRFSLITLSNIDDAKTLLLSKIDNLTILIENETHSISKFLDIIACNSSMRQKQMNNKLSAELREIKSESSRILSKILAIAYNSQKLEDLISEFCDTPKCDKKSEEILEEMSKIATEISLSHDEMQRILILFQKYLNIEVDEDGKIPPEKIENLQNALEKVKRITDEDFSEPKDDFFFVDGKENEVEEEAKTKESAIEEIDSKLAKKYFKPVLVQLRERIEVIGEDFKERERKVLKSKGIEIDEIEQMNAKPLASDDDSGSDDERERQRRHKKNQEKFQQNREFLESKQQINIFANLAIRPMQNFDEDVIE